MTPTRPSHHAPATLRAGASRCLGLGLPLSVGVVVWVGSATPCSASPPPEPEPSVDPAEPDALAPVWIRVLPGDDRVVARLRAELGLLGYPVIVDTTADAAPLGPDLLDELEGAGAGAAIEIVLGDNRVDLWVADGATHKALARRLDLVAAPEQRDPRTIAIAAVELLRASLLEVASSEEPEPEPPRPVEADPTDDPDLRPAPRPNPVERPVTGALSLAAVVGGSPGGFGVTTHVELAGRWVPLPRFALRVSAWIPTVGNSVAVTDGRVRMFVGMAFVEPQLRLPGGAKWFHPELGLGLGAAVVGFEGIANEGLRSDTRILGGFAGHTHVGLGFTVMPRLWIRVDGYVGTVQPRPEIRSTTDAVEATWGLPFAHAALGLEIWL